ncbi:MAG: M20 family metallo-hydrolase [candidate division WOR-3 bacterium]|nr:M20 family metallo-hydrolase [candidate division WOR-3 bacterium]
MWQLREWQKINESIENLRDYMIRLQCELTAIPAIGPENGGDGEAERGKYLLEVLKELTSNLPQERWQISEYNAPDLRVKSNYRPNIIATFRGVYPAPKIWIMTHIDIVPPGSLSLWETDPYKAVVKDGKIYGRGTEDNQQELVASIAAVKALKDLGFNPIYDVNLIFVSDEETGSHYGAGYLLNNFRKLFSENDIYIIPDAGNPNGSLIEIAEKSILWLKFTIKGKQTHAASAPQGINAHRAGAYLIVALDKMFKKKYKKKNRLFSPPISTAEPTKKESNVPNVNTVPGEDVFYFDCRILPDYPVTQVLEDIKTETEKIEKKFGVQVELENTQISEAAPITPPDSVVVKILKKAIKEVYKINAKPGGIGGGTVAALFRKNGLQAAVWSKVSNNAHQPNEFSIIDNMTNDAKVFACLMGIEIKELGI